MNKGHPLAIALSYHDFRIIKFVDLLPLAVGKAKDIDKFVYNGKIQKKKKLS